MDLDEVVARGRDVRAEPSAELDDAALALVSAARRASRAARRHPWDVGPVDDPATLAERPATLVDRRPTTLYHPTDRRCAPTAHERES